MTPLIIGLNGSPKSNFEKSSTRFLIQKALEGAEEEGFETDIVDLSQYDLKLCNGCDACLKRTCPLDEKDDMPKIKEKLLAADGFVFGSPSYFGGVTGLMKTVIDRSRDLKMPEAKLTWKTAGFVASAGLRVGGQESVFQAFINWCLGQGMIIVGASGNPYTTAPFTAGTLSYDVDGKPKFRSGKDDPIAIVDAKVLGSSVAKVTKKLLEH